MKLFLVILSILAAGISHDDIEVQISNISESIVSDPLNYRLYQHRGKLFCKKRKYLNAIRDFERCIHLDSSQSETYLDLALCWSKLEKYDYSLGLVNGLISKSGKSASVLRLKGNILISGNKYDAGISELISALNLSTRKLPEYYLQIANECLNSKSKVLLIKAKNILMDGIKELGPLIVLQDKCVAIHLALNETKEAIEIQTDIIDLYERKEHALYARALMYISKNNYDRAMIDVESAYTSIESLPMRYKKSQSITSLLKKLDELVIQILEVE